MPGDPKVCAEPFAGSRAVKADPEAVARHCDHSTFHADLTARHGWLREWGDLHRKRVLDDPDYFDARADGWWVWGISLWIGGGWCQITHDRRPWSRLPAEAGASARWDRCRTSTATRRAGRVSGHGSGGIA